MFKVPQSPVLPLRHCMTIRVSWFLCLLTQLLAKAEPEFRPPAEVIIGKCSQVKRAIGLSYQFTTRVLSS